MNTPLPPVGVKTSAADRDRDDVMASVDDALPQRESPEVAVPREERAVDMDYEVADDEDGW